MAEFPALPLWTDAYLADTGHLTFEEHGLYLNLLILMWRSPECRIPNDPEWLNRRFPDHANALHSLCQEFCTTDAQWIWQKRLQKEWQWCKDKKQKNKLAAEARWSKTLDKNDANASFTQCERSAPIPTPTPLLSKDKKEKIDDKTGKGDSKKSKPRHLQKSKTGNRLWCDKGTSEWSDYILDYHKAHEGVDPPMQWENSGAWFYLAGEPARLNGNASA